MIVVMSQGAIRYLGTNNETAIKVMGETQGVIFEVKSLGELQEQFEFHTQTKSKPKNTNSRLDEVLERLEEIDLAGEAEDVLKKTRENGEYAIGQVRSMGLRGLKGLGEGFTAIGDLLQKAGEEEVEVIENPEKRE